MASDIQNKYIETVDTLGFRVNLGSTDNYIDLIEELINSGEKACFFNHNLHTLYSYFRNGKLKQLYQGKIVVLDGMPLVWLLRILGFNAKRDHRVTYAQFIWPLLIRAHARRWRVFYIGPSTEIQQRAFANLRQRFPGIIIRGHHGYFDTTPGSADNRLVVKQINEFKTDLCIVGMGTPRQEFWVEAHRELINAPALLVSGACLEYVSGDAGTPPHWMGQWGLEWSYRLIENPRRFAQRYLLEPWVLAVMLMFNALTGPRRNTD